MLLPGWQHHEELRGAVLEEVLFAEALDNGKTEGERLAHSGALPGDEVVLVIDDVVGFVLDGEQLLDTLFV